METKDNSARALILLIFMSLMGVLLLAMLIASAVWSLDLSKMSHEDSYYIDYYFDSVYANFFGVASILYSLSAALTGVSFLFWFQRVYNNLVCIGIKHFTYKSYLVWLSWFIPLVNFIIPYKIMKEIWDEIENLNREESQKYHEETSYTLVNCWWLFFIIMSIINFFASNIIFSGSFTDLQLGVLLHLFGSIAGVVSLICLYRIIIKIRNNEKKYFIVSRTEGLISDDEI